MRKTLLNPLLASMVLILGMAVSARAEIKLSGLFTDGAVLQQKREVPIWGTGKEGEKVTVKFKGQEVSTVVKDGHWLVKLKPLEAGGPDTMEVVGENTITIGKVLVGEVWLCSGQSNMGFRLSRASNAEDAIAASEDAELRVFTVPRVTSDAPVANISGEWKASNPASAGGFSAVAYFFGRDLRRALKVPVGLIDSSVGGTPAEAWTSRETLESDPELKNILAKHAAKVEAYDPAKADAQYQRDLAKQDGKETSRKVKKAGNPARANTRPCGLYNAMIAPLQPYAMAGVIWYQGEANSGRAAEYQILFPALIRNWRTAWGQGEFPFLFVQIAPNSGMSPEIREAQLLTSKKVSGTAMIVTVDVGEANDIHPKKKEPVGARLALAARAIAYQEKIEYSGPIIEKMNIRGNRATLAFTHTGGGLIAQGGQLRGFTISGDGENFLAANAEINGEQVDITAAAVKKPIAVRYGWERVPDVNLFNKAGLPASPFRISVR